MRWNALSNRQVVVLCLGLRAAKVEMLGRVERREVEGLQRSGVVKSDFGTIRGSFKQLHILCALDRATASRCWRLWANDGRGTTERPPLERRETMAEAEQRPEQRSTA